MTERVRNAGIAAVPTTAIAPPFMNARRVTGVTTPCMPGSNPAVSTAGPWTDSSQALLFQALLFIGYTPKFPGQLRVRRAGDVLRPGVLLLLTLSQGRSCVNPMFEANSPGS